MKFFPFIFVLLLTSCQLNPFKQKETKKPGQDQPLVTAAAKTDAATNTADTATTAAQKKDTARDGKVLANVNHARERNQDNPDGAPKTIVDGDLQVAQSLLADVQPDAETLAQRARDAALVEAGKASEARANYAAAAQDAKKLTEELATARIEAANALAARDKARTDEAAARQTFIDQLAQNKKDNDAVLAALNTKHQRELDAERNKMLHAISYALIGCAVVCILIGAFSVYSKVQTADILRAATVGAVWGGAAGFCIACAWTINQPWFKWVVIGGGALGLVAGVLYFWAEFQSTKKAKTRIKEADEAEDALKKVMNTLEHTLPKDDPLFQKLSGKLSDNHKALLNELKAEEQRATI